VAVVNASFAKRYFGDGIAVGRHFGLGTDPGTPANIEIVGVVNDTRYEGLRDAVPLLVYMCASQRGGGGRFVYARTERDPDSAMAAVRAAVREVDSNVPWSR